MSVTLTLNLPDVLFRPIQRTAQAMNMPVESALLKALTASIPPLDGLPPAWIEELTQLESQKTATLQKTLAEMVSPMDQRRLNRLLKKGVLTPKENLNLKQLQEKADRVMLRKAHAAALLRLRGERVPTLAELRKICRVEK